MNVTPLKIGNVTCETPVVLGPMAGVTDISFRKICREMGAGLVSMEMVSAKGLHYHNRNTGEMLKIDETEHPVALQLFGSEPDILAEVCGMLSTHHFDIIDFNMGCPVPKVVKNHEGSALMRNPKLAAEIVRAMVREANVPVTVKIRKGFNDEEINAPEVAKYLEDAGAAAIAVHGRTREEYYSGTADWDVIRRVKEAVSIPVIGNGDIDSPEKAQKMFEQTGVDGVMISRAARGNPWIFHQVSRFLEDGTILPDPTFTERKALMLRHAQMMIEDKGRYNGIHQMRSHAIWYTMGLPHAAKLRKEVGSIASYEDLQRVLDNYEAVSYNAFAVQ